MSEPTDHCLLFDSDGTLVDSEAINTQALADELASHDIDEDAKVLLDRYRGWQFKAVLSDLAARHGTALHSTFEFEFRSRASRYFETRLKPVAGIQDALQALDDTRCIASNAPMKKLMQVLELTNLNKYFSGHLFSAYDISKFKPDPGLFLHAAHQMGFQAKQCIVIEDSVVGLQAALAAKMKCVWYCHDAKLAQNLPVEIQAGLDQKRILSISSMNDLPTAVSTIKVVN